MRKKELFLITFKEKRLFWGVGLVFSLLQKHGPALNIDAFTQDV